jgi:hypothetical protein
MRWLVLALIATALAPWPGIPALPNGTGVTVLRQNARLPANEEVAIWLSLPNETSPKVLLGRASSDGQDVWLTGSDAAGNTSGAMVLSSQSRSSFRQVLKDAYRIELRFKEPEARKTPGN